MNDPSREKLISQQYITYQPGAALPGIGNMAPALPPLPPGNKRSNIASRAPPDSHINLHINPKLNLFWAKTGGKVIKKIMQDVKEAGQHVPKNNNGDEMCITFHGENCSSNCQRCFDHNALAKAEKAVCKKHTPKEGAKLIAWCQAAFD